MGVYIKCQYKILENKKSPFDCDIFSTVNNCGHNTDNGEILFIFLNEVLLFILHRDPAKCICNRACKNDQGEDRTYVFDHHNKDLLSAECTLAMTNLLFYLIDSHNS